MKSIVILPFILLFNFTFGQITTSPNGAKDALLVGVELLFETSYQTLHTYMTEEIGFKYLGIKEHNGAYIVEFESNSNNENWSNIHVVYMDKDLSKQYGHTYSLFNRDLIDEYREALINSGYKSSKENDHERFITEKFIYEFQISKIVDKIVYSVWIFRNLNESKLDKEKRYEESETSFNYNELITYSKSDGKPITGIVYKKYKNGKLDFERSYKEGKLDGKSTSWYIGGEKKMLEGNWVNGKRNGKQSEWFLNGRLWKEENYKNGIKDGLHKTWYNTGVLSKEYFYSNEEILYSKCWDENGNLIKCE
jgi:antitoxin component YwqK of YwqJK toxin-antitoxin module